ncbi:hypothetical protein RFI_11406 [Reticulomyxa filosa]|uniref:Uncharacterized protein n=1 Tax=Reticulomyxa filosa TaxID=46433 RepID=X6NIB2_RETFI|nr:hypothetical protein RFI_11406 [Reticulomyxa filosa]|eukprot:ETO25731.1 hypothetical protein RFI_11406 [Reticulomyxa filosa]
MSNEKDDLKTQLNENENIELTRNAEQIEKNITRQSKIYTSGRLNMSTELKVPKKNEAYERRISQSERFFEAKEYGAKYVRKPVYNNVFMEKLSHEVEINESMHEIQRLFATLHFLQEGE